MSLTNDVSWTLLSQIVKQWLGAAVDLEGVKALHGGSMSTTLLLTIKRHGKVVIKIAPHMVVHQYECEAYQLNLLRDWGFPSPEVYQCQVGCLESPHSYLLMEHMPGTSLSEARQSLNETDYDHVERHLADIVLSLHGRTSNYYRRIADGGESGTRDYAEFFRGAFEPILKDVIEMRLLPDPLRRRICSIHEKLDSLLHHDDRPRLIHGDLWASNLLVSPDKHGKWWVSGLLDPNLRYSHAEMELAYLELFKTVTPAFFRVYEQTHRLPRDYRLVRRDVYMMYSLLNHTRLFGQHYAKPLAVVADRVAKALVSRRNQARRIASAA